MPRFKRKEEANTMLDGWVNLFDEGCWKT